MRPLARPRQPVGCVILEGGACCAVPSNVGIGRLLISSSTVCVGVGIYIVVHYFVPVGKCEAEPYCSG